MNPLISVVITSFNDGRYLPRALESVKAQTHRDWEVVICDDGSTDGSSCKAALALAQDRVRIVLHEVNRGLAAARNSAIKAAFAPIIVLLDADDTLPARALELAAQAFEQNPSADFAYGHTLEKNWEDDSVSIRKLRPDSRFGESGWMPWCGCSPLKKALWERVGGYDESEIYRRAPEEIDFWMRVAAHDARGVFVDAILYEYLRRPGSLGHEFTPRALVAALNSLNKPEAFRIRPSLRRKLGISTALFGATYWRRRGKPLAGLWALRHGIRFNPASLRLWKAALGCVAEALLPPLRRRYTVQHEAREHKAQSYAS